MLSRVQRMLLASLNSNGDPPVEKHRKSKSNAVSERRTCIEWTKKWVENLRPSGVCLDDKKCFNGDPQQFAFRIIKLHGCVGCYFCHFTWGGYCMVITDQWLPLRPMLTWRRRNDHDHLHLHWHPLSFHLLWPLTLLMTKLLQSGSTTVHCQNH